MTNKRPDVEPHSRYSQKDAARHLGVDRHTVRRYESLGLIRFTQRPGCRRKVTTGEQIIRCWEDMFLSRNP